MKKFSMVLLFMFVFSTVGFASPLMDYSQGKGAIDLTFRISNNLDYDGWDVDGKNSNLDAGLTIGLGNNLAFQWQHQSADSKIYSGSGVSGGYSLSGSMKSELTADQINILYKLDNNAAAFVGYTRAENDVPLRGTVDGTPINGTLEGKSVTGFQVGVIGSFPLSDNLTGFGTVGFGNKIESFEFGIAYEMAKNTELNVSYKNIKYKDLKFDYPGTSKYDLKVDGLAAGITYRF